MSTQAGVGAKSPEPDLIALGTPSISTAGTATDSSSVDAFAAHQPLYSHSQDRFARFRQRQPPSPFACLAEEDFGAQCQFCTGSMQSDVRRASLSPSTCAVQQTLGRRGSEACTGHEMRQGSLNRSGSIGSGRCSMGRQTREQTLACSKQCLAEQQQRRSRSPSTVLLTCQQSGSLAGSASYEDLVSCCPVCLQSYHCKPRLQGMHGAMPVCGSVPGGSALTVHILGRASRQPEEHAWSRKHMQRRGRMASMPG